jgi:YVTN family beta-propeller protein
MKNLKKNIIILSFILLMLVIPKQTFAVPIVSITSPTNLEQLSSSGTIDVVGTATANTSVNLLLDGNSVGTTSVDGLGDWSLTISNVSAGPHSLEAVVTKQGKTIFSAMGSPGSVNSIDPSNGALNTIANFPISVAQPAPAIAISPDGDTAYASGHTTTNQYLVKVDLLNGATSQVSGLPANSKITTGVFNVAGTKYYAPDSNSGTARVFVIDVASNTLSSTINLGSGLANIATLINGNVYINDFGSSQIHIINPADDTFTSFSPSCTTTDITDEPDNSTSYWVGCSDGNVLEYAVSDNSTLTTVNSGYGSGFPGITRLANSSKIFVTNVFSGNNLKVFDTQTQALLATVPLGAQPWYLVPSYDNTKIVATLPGLGFSGTDIALIDVSDYSVQNITTSGPSLKASSVATQNASSTISFNVAQASSSSSSGNQSNSLASTGQNESLYSIIASIICSISILYSLLRLRTSQYTR